MYNPYDDTQIIPSVDYVQFLKVLTLNETTNQNTINVPKVVNPTNNVIIRLWGLI